MKLAYNDSFAHVLKYFYSGKLILNNEAIDRVFDFMSISKKFNLTTVMEEMSLLLEKALTLENVVIVYEKAHLYDQKQLMLFCEHFIDEHATILLAQKMLFKLSSECFKRILSRNSFNLSEDTIFDLVNEWHIFHNRTERIDNDLVKKIRFELFPKAKLVDLMRTSSLLSEQITNHILHQRFTNGNANKPDRHIKMASGSRDNTIRIWDAETGECIRTLSVNSNVFTLQLVANNKLASGSADNLIKMWNIDTGECIATLAGHSNIVITLQLLANNKLASGSADRLIKIWNLDSGECIRTLTGHSKYVESLELLPNNKLASGSLDHSIKIWNFDSGECIRTLVGHTDTVSSLELLANNKLASGSWDKLIKIWNVDNGECVRTLTGHSGWVMSLQLIADNKLASGSEDKKSKSGMLILLSVCVH